MRVLDLFSGIGGFSLGLERAGFQTVAFCEIEPFCQQILKKHWPDVPIFPDVRTLKGEQVGPVDVVCGGYPCQPFSTAGKRGGAEDDRHLWPEMRRLVEELRPTWVIGENVAGHITLGLDEVLSDLEALGYATRAFVIPACAVDAPHRRDRVWTVAHADKGGKHDVAFHAEVAGASQSVAHPNSTGLERRVSPGVRERGTKRASGESGSFVRHTSSEGLQDRQPGTLHGPGQNEELERPDWWPSDAGIRRVANGVRGRVDRIKALGNSIVPQVAEVIGRAILQAQGGEK